VPHTKRYLCARVHDLGLHHQVVSIDCSPRAHTCAFSTPQPTHMGLNLSTVHPKVSTTPAHGVRTRGAMLKTRQLDNPKVNLVSPQLLGNLVPT
jgi:hypothetical protein